MSSLLPNPTRTSVKSRDVGRNPVASQNYGDVSTSRYSVRSEDEYISRQERERAELAVQIGIDYENEKHKYGWFLEQVINLELPPEWIQEEDPDGRAIYYNESENVTTTRHPLINKFRAIFSDILKSEEVGRNSAENFLKAYKEKMQVVGFEKKDDKKKGKKAPQQAIVLGSTLSHQVLKGHARDDKTVRQGTSETLALMEEGKSKERYERLKELLNRGKAVQAQANEVDNIQVTEKVLQEYRDFYRNLYGKKLIQIPPAIESSKEYLHCEPNDVADAAKLFGVFRNEAYLFWTLRTYASMPLPELWTKTFDPEQETNVYMDLRTGAKLTVHPCFLWVKDVISYLRELAKNDLQLPFSATSRMTFHDALERGYEVDVGGLFHQNEENPGARSNPGKISMLAKASSPRAGHRRFEKKETNPSEKNSLYLCLIMLWSKDFRDAHLLELANQLKIDVNFEVHLMMVIEDFVREKDKDERWFFRQTVDGQSFWVNHERKKAVKEYPHLDELKKCVEEARKRIKNDNMSKFKKDGTLIKTLFRKYTEETALRILMQEAKHFVEYFLSHKEVLQEDPTMAERKGYNLSKLTKLIGGEVSKADLLDILFYCPFDFSAGLGELNFGGDAHLLKKFRLMTRYAQKSGEQKDEGDEDSDASDITTESAKERRAKIRNPRKLITAADGFKDEGLFKKEGKKEFLKMIFDFEQKYGDTDLIDDLDYDKMMGDAQKKALAKKEKEKEKEKQPGSLTLGKKTSHGATKTASKTALESTKQHHQGLNRNANTLSTTSLAGDTKLKSLGTLEKVNSLGSNQGVSSRGTPEPTERKLNQAGPGASQHAQQDQAKVTSAADVKKGGTQTLSQQSNSNATSNANAIEKNTKDQMLDRLKEGHGISLGKWEGLNISNRGEANKEQGGLAQKADAQGYVRQTLAQKLGIKWVNNDDESSKKSLVNLAELQKKLEPQGQEEEEEEEEETSEDEEEGEINLRISKGESKGGEAGKHGLKIRDTATDKGTTERSVGDKGKESKGTKAKKKKKSRLLIKSRESVGDEVLDEFGKVVSRKESINKINTKQQQHYYGYKEVEEIGPNGEKIKKRVPVEMKNPSRDLSGGTNSFTKQRRQMSPSIRMDSYESISEDGGSIGDYLRMVRKHSKDVLKSKTEVSIQKTVTEGTEEEEPVPEGVNVNIHKPSLYDVLASVNLLELDKQVNAKDWKELESIRSKERNYRMQKKRDPYEREMSPAEKNVDYALNYMVASKFHGSSPDGRRSGVKTQQSHTKSNNRLFFNPRIETDASEFRRPVLPIRASTNKNFASTQRGFHTDRHFHPAAAGASGKSKVTNKTTDFMQHVKMRLFIKQLDEIVIDFLIKQFAELQVETLNNEGDVDMPEFRARFIQNNQRLISHLRERLFQNKEFVKNIYTQMFINFLGDEVPRETFYNNISSQLRDSSPSRGLIVPPLNVANLSVEAQSRAELLGTQTARSPNLLEAETGGKREGSFKLPQLGHGVKGNSALYSSTRELSTTGRSLHNKQPELFLSVILILKAYGLICLTKTQRTKAEVSKLGARTDRAQNTLKNNLDAIKTDVETRETTMPKSQDNLRLDKMILTTKSGNENDFASFSRLKTEREESNPYYAHYVRLLGDPASLSHEDILERTNPPKTVHSYSLVLMAARFKLKINGNDSDLAWIPYIALATPLPPDFEQALRATTAKDKLIQRICYLKFGEHPGDLYFRKVIDSYSNKRQKFIAALKPDEIKQYKTCHSWLKFRNEGDGEVFYFNMLTKEKSSFLPSSAKSQLEKYSDLQKLHAISLINHLLKEHKQNEVKKSESVKKVEYVDKSIETVQNKTETQPVEIDTVVTEQRKPINRHITFVEEPASKP